MPNYDEDTSLVYLCGKGDTFILPVEVSPSSPQPLFPVSKFESPGATLQQGVVFIPKKSLDVKNIEIAKCWRLTQNSIEPISFSLSRNRNEFFQDDLFPLTRNYENATMKASEWFNTSLEVVPEKNVDLCPKDMVKCRNI